MSAASSNPTQAKQFAFSIPPKTQNHPNGWMCFGGDVYTLNQHIEKWQETNLSDQLFTLRQLSSQLAVV